MIQRFLAGPNRLALRAVWTLGLLGAPRAALACPVCFGNSDSPLAIAMNDGILMMLVVVGGMLSAFAYFIVYLIRRAKLVAAKEMTEGIAQ
jgi:hypothetical protein